MNSESELLTTMDGGIQTIIPLAANASQQIVYLDFDGATASYHNRDLGIEIDGVAVEDSGFDSATISVIVAALNGQFGDDVLFTSELPSEGEFSTIYIGVTSAFDEYGSFYGLAETIDSGNKIHDDNAFVLLDSSASSQMVVSVVAHETEHIVHGMEHGGEGLDRYASYKSGDTVYGGATIRSGWVIASDANVNEPDCKIYNVNGRGGKVYDTDVLSGGILNNVVVAAHASGSYGYIEDIRISNGGSVIVRSAGNVGSNITLYGGMLYVQSAATVKEITQNGGTISIDSGVTIEDVTFNGGTFNVTEGATVKNLFKIGATNITLYTGATVDGGEMYAGQLQVLSNVSATSSATIKNYTIYGGLLIVRGSGNVADTIKVSQGGALHVQGGASGLNVDVYDGGILALQNQANVYMSSVRVHEGGYINGGNNGHTYVDVTVDEGATWKLGNNFTLMGDIAFNEGALINDPEATAADGVIYDLHLNSTVRIASGVTVSRFTLTGGKLYVSSGATANSTTVNSGGTMYVSDGTVTETTVNSDGGMYVSGGTVTETTVKSGGGMYVSGGTVVVPIDNSSSMIVSSGGTAIDTTVEGSGSMDVVGSGIAIGTTVSGGLVMVWSSALAKNTLVTDTGEFHISKGGTATSTTVDSDGFMCVSDAIANETTLSANGLLNVFSGGTANSTTVDSDGQFSVFDKGTANYTTVNEYGYFCVYGGGTANSTTVNLNGDLTVSGGGTATAIVENGGFVTIWAGATVTFASNVISGLALDGESATIHSGTTANGVTMDSYAELYVYNGGVANTVVASDANIRVSGGTVNEANLGNDAELYVYNSGLVNSVVASGAYVYVSSGTANEATICNGGFMEVSVSGKASSTTVTDGGELDVFSGGTANGVSVGENGFLFVSTGGTMKGNIQIASGAVVSAYAGAIFDFTVAGQTDATTPLIDRYDCIDGAADAAFTLTVKASQAVGQYALAAHAQDFNGTISVKTIDGDALGDLSLSTTLESDGMEYRLALDGTGTLTLNVKVDASFVVSNPDVGGESSFDEAFVTDEAADIVGFNSSNTIYYYSDGLTATHGMEVFGNGTDATTLSGGALYLAGNETSFSDITLDGQVFGGFQLSDGSNECDAIALSFSGVVFTDGARVFGGADLSGTATATVGNISLGMDDVDGGSARIFGAGRVAGDANLVVGDIDVTISCAKGGSFSNYFAGAEAKSGFEGSIICGEVNTVIDDGEFTYCGNGSQLRGGTSEQNDSTLTVNGGTFNYFVYAGAFSAGGVATVDGDTTLTINGGTFNSHVFGGCGANNSTNGANTAIDGDVSVTVDATNNSISFAGNLYAGSIGAGTISGSTTMTFTGDGKNLSFATNSYVTGGSQMSKNVPEYIGGTATLAFDKFSGAFAASVNNGFTKVALSGSDVSFTGRTVFLGAVSEWAIEVADKNAELTLAKGKNSFEGDTLEITLAEGAAPSSGGWEVIAGTDATLAGWDAFSSVSLGGEAATFADGEWSTDTYRLYREDNVLKLASIA